MPGSNSARAKTTTYPSAHSTRTTPRRSGPRTRVDSRPPSGTTRPGRVIPSGPMLAVRRSPEPVHGTAEVRLIVFTLGPRRDARRRPLLPEQHRAVEVDLRAACLDGILTAAREAGLTPTLCSPTRLAMPGVAWWPQPGETFAARLAWAVRRACAGGRPAVVVGGDVPDLDPGRLRAALEAVTADPGAVAIGPSPDGGFYLLATTTPLDAELASVPFGGTNTRTALVGALRAAGRRVVLLPELRDLDTPADLERLLRANSPAHFAARCLLAERRRPRPRRRVPYRSRRPAAAPGRAPPAPLR